MEHVEIYRSVAEGCKCVGAKLIRGLDEAMFVFCLMTRA